MKPLKLQNHNTLTIDRVFVIEFLNKLNLVIAEHEKMNILI